MPGFEQWRTERREIVRRHHPDRGGDPAVLVTELELLEQRHRPAGPPVVTPTGGPAALVRRGLRRARLVTRDRVRTARASLPQNWPGHRRYHDIS